MAVETTPIWIQAGGEDAEHARRAVEALYGYRGGLAAPGDLKVSESATPAMSVSVAAGRCIIPGTEGTAQGVYVVEARTATTVTISGADPTNARIDLIVVKVQDSDYSGSVDAVSIVAVTGTAAATPVEPTVPDNAWVLAKVAVAADASSITNAVITDQRTTRSGQETRGPQKKAVTTDESTSTTTYTDLTTTGPAVTVHLVTGQTCLVFAQAGMYSATSGDRMWLSYAVSGASTVAASDTAGFKVRAAGSNIDSTFDGLDVYTATASGDHTFTLKYRFDSGTGPVHYLNRKIIVTPTPLPV